MNLNNMANLNDTFEAICQVQKWLEKLKNKGFSTNPNRKVMIDGDTITIENLSACLKTSQSIKQILEVFLIAPNYTVTKSHLIYCLYGDISEKSNAYKRSITHNTIKRLSRCRQFLREQFGPLNSQLRWLNYDNESGQWHLYKNRQY